MDNNYLQNARKDRSLIHKLFLFIPIAGDIIPIAYFILALLINFNEYLNREVTNIMVAVFLFFSAVVGIIMIFVIVWYFVFFKVKSFSYYAFLGIGFSIVCCLESSLLLYLFIMGLRNI